MSCPRTGDCRASVAALFAFVAAAAAVRASAPRREALEPGARRPVVGLFVHTWHDQDARRQVVSEAKAFPMNGWNWWARPAFAGGDMARYSWKNRAMVDYHIDNWIKLGVDFVFLDFTNGNQPRIMEGAHALCRRLQQRRDGPKVVFWVKTPQDADLYREQYYDRYPNVVFRWKGKPLLLVRLINRTGKPPPPPPASDYFTTRWCWGLLGGASGSMWTFKEFGLPKPYVHAGVSEQVGITVSAQVGFKLSETGGVLPPGRKCRDGGSFFRRQAAHARALNPEIITICGYNEWMAMNLGTKAAPMFVDLASPECSHDIEPMLGGHGDAYFRMVQEFVRSLKA